MKALVTGCTGQDGSFLCELLLSKGYEVHGIVRRSSSFNTGRIEHLYLNEYINSDNKKLFLHYGDMTDALNIYKLIDEIRPDEIYNLAAQSHVKISFDIPAYTAITDGIGALNILDAVKSLNYKCKIYQASSSELFGNVQEIPQKETTPFYPRSPYGVAKLYGYWITKNYREAYGMFASNGILFNHESERRGENFVTRKITSGVARIEKGLQKCLILGNLDAKRDWGYAKDYVECMWLMLQQNKPDDYIIATGENHTVREFVEQAFREIAVELEWSGAGTDEVGKNKITGETLVKINERYYRPAEVSQLLGDPTKAIIELGWNPHKTSFKELVKIMMKYDREIMYDKRGN